MDVSHFELIYKPQSPAAPTGTANVDTLIQGYFLEITNLEDEEYRYRVDFLAAPVADPLRSVSGNTVVFVDTPDGNNQQGVLSGAITATTFRPSTGFITVPPRGTALIAVLPSAFGPLPGEPTPLLTPDFEVRGYVRIGLPALLTITPGNPFPIFSFEPQSDGPVRVLLTPQNRTTYFNADGSISDQTQASLPLASGTAVNELSPESGLFTIPSSLTRAEELARELESMPGDIAGMVGAMLASPPTQGGKRGAGKRAKTAEAAE